MPAHGSLQWPQWRAGCYRKLLVLYDDAKIRTKLQGMRIEIENVRGKMKGGVLATIEWAAQSTVEKYTNRETCRNVVVLSRGCPKVAISTLEPISLHCEVLHLLQDVRSTVIVELFWYGRLSSEAVSLANIVLDWPTVAPHVRIRFMIVHGLNPVMLNKTPSATPNI